MPRRAADPIRIYAPGERSRSRPNRWCVAEIWVGGRRRAITFDGIADPAEARSLADEYLGAAEKQCAEQGGAPAGPRTFAELAERYAADVGISRHERAYVDRLTACRMPSLGNVRLGDVRVEALSPALAREAAQQLYGQRAAKTKNRAAISPFAAVVHYGAEGLGLMPYMRIKGFKVVEKLTPRLPGGDVGCERLLAAARAAKPHPCMSKRDRADFPYRYLLYLFLFRQGWKITETLRLAWSQVDLVNGLFMGVEVDKGGTVKDLPINPDVYEALANLPEGEPERALRERRGRVFPWCDRHNVYRWSNRFADEVVGLRFRPHQARVEYATELSQDGVSNQGIAGSSTWKGGPGGTRAIDRYTRTDAAAARAANARAGRRHRADATDTAATSAGDSAGTGWNTAGYRQ